MDLIKQLKDAIIEGEDKIASELAQKIIDDDLNLQEVILKGLSEGMKEVGRLYEEREYFIPEIIISADALTTAFEIFKPHLKDQETVHKATVIIGVVKGDIHEIGKNIVSVFLTISNYNVIDLGRNVHSDNFIKAIKENNAQILCLSTLMTPTLDEMGLIIEKLKKEGLKDNVKVMIGGAPTDDKFKNEINADFYCTNAIEAIDTLDKYFNENEQEASNF